MQIGRTRQIIAFPINFVNCKLLNLQSYDKRQGRLKCEDGFYNREEFRKMAQSSR